MTYPYYTWNFGDGTTVSGYAPGTASGNNPESDPCEEPWIEPCAGSVFHSYLNPGTYDVTLTVKDVGGTTASVTQAVTVVGEPIKGGGGGGQNGGSNQSGSGGSGGSSGQTQSTPAASATAGMPAPVAHAVILSRSLPHVLHSGLLVGYSVNEQVAGHFEVLVSRALARRLGIGGEPAGGLPSGSPAQVVIARAILITTAGGHSTVHIELSKRTDARLRHKRLRKLPLMVRLVVRNASRALPRRPRR